MNVNRRKMMGIFAVSAALVLTACGGSGSSGSERLAIGTGGSGGVFYVLGAGMANLVTDSESDMTLSAQATAATEENLRMVQNGDLDFAFSVYDAAVDAYNGEGDYPNKYDNLRLVMPGHNGYLHFMTRKGTGIEGFEDFEGKRVGTSPGYVGEKLVTAAVSPYGLTGDDIDMTALSFTEMGDGLRNKTLDVASVTAGLPGSSVVELKASLNDLEFISQTEEGQKKLVEEYPYWVPATIKKDVYDTKDDIRTFAAPYVIVANKDVSNEAVQKFADVIYSNPENIEAIHAEGSNYTLDNPMFDQDPLLPFHDGMDEYLKNKGSK